ncbi:MAG TPA: MoxR family ATPase [Rhodothermales bacterium]|nr:MoxR family ATPase [Rhodothermales bacterium]
MSPDQAYANRTDLTALSEAVENIKSEIGKIIIGQTGMVDMLIAALLANGHVLIEGVPGVAKTMTAKLLARTVSVGFSRIQFTPDLLPSDVLGTAIFDPKSLAFTFRRGPIFGNLVLVDEINRAPAKTQAALFEVMEERQVTVDGTTYPMQQPFMVLATQNPVEHEGTYRLPEAQLDRFLFKILVDYPTIDEEVQILSGFHARQGMNNVASLTPLLSGSTVQQLQVVVQSLHVEEKILRYMAQITTNTRNNPALYLGASPRASLALLTGSKAFAALRGRDFVTPEDVQAVAYPVLRHRIQLSPEREMEGSTPDQVIKSLIEKVEVPR